MKKYAIKRKNRDQVVSILNYDEKNKSYTIDIPKDVPIEKLPFMMSICAKKGMYHIGEDLSMKWVRGRIIPSSRQNIGQILRENGMKSYDEQTLLLKNRGESCQDEYYIVELEK